MNTQTEEYDRLIKILKELFQLDQADLDFGIYRIMNQKRDEVTDFLENRLIGQVEKTLKEAYDKDRESIEQELKKLKKTLHDAGVEPETSEKYQHLQGQLLNADTTDLQNTTFSHLTNFFKRYYKEGDFVSQRRYKDDVYAVPYQGEEVKLHWANHDQYYIKTSEYFKNYRFKLRNGKWINFELQEASTEQNNNKSQNGERKFKLAGDEVYRENGDALTIFFTYEPMSKKKKQDKLMDKAFDKLKDELPSKWLTELLQPKPTKKDKKRTLLQKHLKDYTARNTFDYFIHKDLGKFLRRELDFYVKNEILHIDDIDLDKEESYREALQVIKAFKKVGLKIIDFLTQLEEFQKKLWLKKKFVLQSDYCITLDRIDEEFYEEIATNKQQREEWVNLYAIDELDDYSESLTVEFLKENPFLMVDTQFYSREWKYDLLATMDQLDEQTGGLMINSENFQALKFLEKYYREQIDTVYIDPPYNTENDRNSGKFIYKDNYPSSSWISLMNDRLVLSKSLLKEDGSIWTSIDDNEIGNLKHILSNIFGKNNFINRTLIWYFKDGTNKGYIARAHDYIVPFAKNINELNPFFRPKGPENISVERITNAPGPKNPKSGILFKEGMRSEIENAVFEGIIGDKEPIEIEGKLVFENGKLKNDTWLYSTWRNKDQIESFIAGEEVLDEKGQELFDVYFNTKGKPKYKKRLKYTSLKSVQSFKDTNTIDLDFPYPKPLELPKLIALSTTENGIIMDFFAGSGTTGHAVIDLNREDQNQRKYIMVDMGYYLDTITKPRIKKAVYSRKWKGGKPVDRKGISHMFKYLRLESYEDTLNNLALNRSEQQQQLLTNEDLKEEYILNYMLDVEARESLLNTDMFKQPFGYTIEATEHNKRVPTEVDLVETFNYLIGLHVVSIQMIKGYVIVTGHNNDGEHILIIWRDTEKHSNEELEDFVNTMEFNPLDGEFDTIYVNRDNNLQNLRKDEDTWKVRLIEEEFHKRMFDEKAL